MPNLVYCSLIMQGDQKDIDHVKLAICGIDENNFIRPIDFNKIIPMPPELNISHDETVKQLAYQKYIRKSVEKHLEIFLKGEGKHTYLANLQLAEKYYDNYQKYFFMTWHDWCIAHWGTKWNAMYDDFQEHNTDPTVIHFTTANDPPLPVVNALACIYPHVDFTLEYFIESDHDTITTVHFKLGEPKT